MHLKLTILISVISLYSLNNLNAQKFLQYYQSNNLKVSDSLGKVLNFPFTGGLKFPVFTDYDLNGDGNQDLVVLDRADGRLMTFLNSGVTGDISFRYMPQFEALFPGNLSRYILLRDYDSDGKPDLFSFAVEWNSGIAVYKNTGTLTQPVFTMVADQIYSQYSNNPVETPIYVSSADIPAFEDLDHDGDLDMISFDVYTGGKDLIKYYRNMSVEKYGCTDSLKYKTADECWGKFYEGDSSNVLILGFTCANIMIKGLFQVPKRHAGSASLLLDYDADGDFDLLLSDVGFPSVILVYNGKNDYSWPRDSMIGYMPGFPQNTKPVSLKNMPGMFYIDINNDGIRDLIISPMDESYIDTFENLDQVWLYRNKGQDNAPDFEFVKSNFLQDEMIDLGGPTSPAFFDFDGDGDKDLFIATQGNYAKTAYKHDRIYVFENTGSLLKPSFKMTNDDFLSLSNKNYMEISPAFGDIDGDGDKDLIFGNGNGRLTWFRNFAPAGQKAEFEFVTDYLDSIDVGYNATPCFYDFNNDGFEDMLVGNKDGNLSYYRNKNISGVGDFEHVTDTFGGIKVNKARYAAPQVYDMDGNGKPDLLYSYNIWNTYYTKELGEIKIYRDIDTVTGHIFLPEDFYVYDSVNRKQVIGIIGLSLRPAVTKLGNDSFPDIVAGNKRGGLLFFSTEFDSVNVGIKQDMIKYTRLIKISPNPVKDRLNISYDVHSDDIKSACIVDLSGKILIQSRLYIGINTIETDKLSSGFYLIVIKNKENKIIFHDKIIKY